MTAERLLKLFDRVADAPDAVARLRSLVLDLAFRGRLLPLERTPRTATVLPCTVVTMPVRHAPAETWPFRIPPTWRWQPFESVATIETNLVNPREHRNLPHIAPDNIVSRTGRLLPYETVGTSGVVSAKHLFGPGQILYSKIRPALAKAVAIDFVGLCSADMYPVRPKIDRQYLLRFMLSEAFVSQTTAVANRVAMPKINQEALNRVLVPVPPDFEQQRIVAKVDELMALCDRLEAAQKEREAARHRFGSATVGTIRRLALEKTGSCGRGLPALPQLLACPTALADLRATLVDLAVQGQLFMLRAPAEKAEAVPGRDDQGERHGPLEAETRWRELRLSDLVVDGPANGISPPPSTNPNAPKALTLSATTTGRLRLDRYKRIDAVVPSDSALWLKPGDLLFQRGNTREYVGIAAVFDGPPRTFLYPDLMIRVRVSDHVDLAFVHLSVNSLTARRYFMRNATGGQATMPKINHRVLLELPLKVPPLAEQRRIVAKVNELMTLCDQLEAHMKAGDIARSRLLDALIAETLAEPHAQPA